jgi:hypothetical protein
MKLLLKILILSIVILTSACKNESHVFNVQDFGAKGKKTQKVTEHIQKAIDACSESGGGIVYFPPGEYLTGTIVIKNNVTLHIEAGAVILASLDEKDYETEFKVYKKNDSGKKGKGETPVLIYAKDAENIGITGKGKIDGQAVRTYEDLQEVDGFIADITENAKKSGVEMKMYYKVKPFTCMVFLESCKNIKIRDVSLVESTDWTLHFKWCDNIFIDNIYLASCLEKGVNADGIDIDGCKNVVITNSIIETGDDAIVLKTTETDTISHSCENVTVSNCVLVSTSTALKLGTESFADFKHITFTNCVIRNSNRGLSIVVRDGATVENVIFSNITIECNRKHFNWWGNGDPIWVVLLKRTPESRLGMIRNVVFENIIAHGQGTSKIEGFEGKPLENIYLRNVDFFMYKEDYADKRATHAFEAHDVNNLEVINTKVFWNKNETEPKWMDAFHLKNIKGLWLDKLSGSNAPNSNGSFITLDNVQHAIIERCKADEGTNQFLTISNSNTKNIILNNNYTKNATKQINFVNGAQNSAISK